MGSWYRSSTVEWSRFKSSISPPPLSIVRSKLLLLWLKNQKTFIEPPQWFVEEILLKLLVLFSSPASLLMSLSASTAVASSDSLSSGISSTLVPSPSSSFIVTTVRTQDFSMVSLSITQTSSVWPSDIHMSSSTSVSSTGTSSRILIRPATSSLNVKASASSGKFWSNVAIYESRQMSSFDPPSWIHHVEFHYSKNNGNW